MAVTPEQYRPTVDELAALMRARTRTEWGKEVSTFTEDTNPTAAEAETMIGTATSLVAARVGGPVPDRLGELAKGLVLLRAAMLVEGSYIPETDGPEGTEYERFQTEYKDALADYDASAANDVGQERRRVGSLKVGTLLSGNPE